MVYLATLLGCLVFFGFYQEWLSWIALLVIAFLPWFSLLLSLPAMLTVKAEVRCPKTVRMGVPARTALDLSGRLPTPPVDCELRLEHSLSQTSYLGAPGELIPTENCGVMTLTCKKLYVYDYLGLFRRKLRRKDKLTVYIMPKPVPAQKLPATVGRTVSLWRPKPGGGFSENHDLRLYRPGDDLRNIHWKMSAKTGKRIYREPIEPVEQGYLLTLSLAGTPAVLDRKLGQLLWLSNRLLAGQTEHSICCYTGVGRETFLITDRVSQEAALCRLLEGPPAAQEAEPEHEAVLWKHHIGGDGHEA